MSDLESHIRELILRAPSEAMDQRVLSVMMATDAAGAVVRKPEPMPECRLTRSELSDGAEPAGWRPGLRRDIAAMVVCMIAAVPLTTPAPMEGICPLNTSIHKWTTYGSYCYTIPAYSPSYLQTATWAAAQNSCLELRGNLASIHEPLESHFIFNLIKTPRVDMVWIGLHRTGLSIVVIFG